MRIGNRVFAEDDLGVDPRLIDVAEHLDDPANWATRGRGPVRDLHGDHPAWCGMGSVGPWNVDVAEHAPVERLDEPHAGGAHVVATDNRLRPPLEDADDA